ncbi:hypothetical protein BOTBODRAFT_222502 [Botryobasidium botryosum FD-172 SS1]|uniref:Ras-GEF domain-containing protein n=1 Tax=Botryobasidium botryosum (strain FD-172 SS1) TaxID=930990 RepID=A0A067MYM5_BOTB1|nr:hypothetical protein BOTBODRAFT_222502 [Botryobasidium botryosum FD-172 SS1]
MAEPLHVRVGGDAGSQLLATPTSPSITLSSASSFCPSSPSLNSSANSLPSPALPHDPTVQDVPESYSLSALIAKANQASLTSAPKDGQSPTRTSNDDDKVAAEIARAELSVSPDGTFVETPSAHAARALKARYDQMVGVGKGGVRSPFAITATKDQYGRRVFRVGNRPTPKLSGDFSYRESTAAPARPSDPRHRSRRARLSVGGFLPQNLFNKPGHPPHAHAPPHEAAKLTKRPRHARSIPDMRNRSTDPTRSPPHQPSFQVVSGAKVGPVGLGYLSDGDDAQHSLSPSRTYPKNRRLSSGADVFGSFLNRPTFIPIPITATLADSEPKKTSPEPSSNVLETIRSPPSPVMPSTLTPRPEMNAFSNNSFPFGDGVGFSSPTLRADLEVPIVHPLRGMQSFESGLTARAEPCPPVRPPISETTSEPILNGTGSPERIPVTVEALPPKYTTTMFDVLQTYRGIPLPDTLSAHSSEPTVMLSSTITAVPKDDPRFVIWGDIHLDDSAANANAVSASEASLARKKSLKSSVSSSVSEVASSPVSPAKKVILAASIERWIAQLTSEIDYDELLNFFLAYRAYISSVDLCHLLICRFHWALEPTGTSQDDTVRKIVRVRTFIAIRYWLMTFFRFDFLPNQELCRLFTTWLNTLPKDEVVSKNADALNIVRKLKKVVRECKATYVRQGSFESVERPFSSITSVMSAPPRTFKPSMDLDDPDVDLDFAPRPPSVSVRPRIPNFNALNVDNPPTHRRHSTALGTSTSGVSPAESANIRELGSLLSPAEGAPPAQALLPPLSILGSAKSAAPNIPTANHLPMQHSALSRAFVNTIGRLGRWKRVLNNRSSVPAPLGCTDIGQFDLETAGDLLTVHGGVEQYLRMLNLTSGGEGGAEPTINGNGSGNVSMVEVREVAESEIDQGPIRPSIEVKRASLASEGGKRLSLASSKLAKESVRMEEAVQVPPMRRAGSGVETFVVEVPRDNTRQSEESRRSLSESGLGAISPRTSISISSRGHGHGRKLSHRFPEIVPLDDFELSSSESETEYVPRVKAKALPRRLPTRKDFEFVRRSKDTVSSLGIRSSGTQSSVASGSLMSTASGGLFDHGGIKPWQIELINMESDDEEEPGDAEAALRRLEGQIDAEAQRAKAEKVDGWMKVVSERRRQGMIGEFYVPDPDQSSRVTSGSFLEDEQPVSAITSPPTEPNTTMSDVSSVSQSLQSLDDMDTDTRNSGIILDMQDAIESSVLERAEQMETPTLGSMSGDGRFKMPLAVLPTKTPTRPSSSEGARAPTSRPTSQHSAVSPPPALSRKTSFLRTLSTRAAPQLGPKLGHASIPTVHRSFILLFRSEMLAQHFCMIDRELFLAIKFEELVLSSWAKELDEPNVLDWGQFLKDKLKLRAAALDPRRPGENKITDVMAARARFSLMANFTSSEIVLSPAPERAMVFGKFIRIAWKLYRHNNFSSLVALIAGLQSQWVTSAMQRSWGRVGMWEMRVFADLKAFTSPSENFKYIRQATVALADSRSWKTQEAIGQTVSNVNSPPSGPKNKEQDSYCVPFLGMYLSELSEYAHLPDYVDPTSPNEAVTVDPATGMLSPPVHPEVFSTLAPLPPSVSLEPLINVHKQRLIAKIVKSVVAGQHLATNVSFTTDRKLYQKCQRLRCLNNETLRLLSSQE